MAKTPPEKMEEQAAIHPEEETQKEKYPLLECLVSLVIPPDTPEKYRERVTHLTEVVD